MASLFTQYGNWLLLIVGVVFFGAAVWTARAALQTRRAAYYATRQAAIHQMRRRAVVAAALLVVLAGLAIALDLQPLWPAPPPVAVISTPTPIPLPPTPTEQSRKTPTLLPSSTPSPSPTSTPTLTPSLTRLPTATLLPTSTLLPSITPQGTLPPQMLTPLPAAASPAPNAKLTFTTFASVLDRNNNPLDAGRVFPASTRRVRVLFRAANVSNNVTWSILCYKNNLLVDSFASPWQWGTRAQDARAFCAIDGSPGTYLVTAYLGLVEQFEATFEVLATPGTPTPTPTVTATATATVTGTPAS